MCARSGQRQLVRDNESIAVATLFGVYPETITSHIRDMRQPLIKMEHTIDPTDGQLTTLEHLYEHSTAACTPVPSKIKTASQ
ncbi:hypothetical protein [Streptomyces brevispora]|uniref:Uncharacterized protein n=1 Tax=Streptomyces brevispora TaxID=887462 RepID=A0A561V6I3_9ACTN|nr:hypothetical protein FHX80_115721 [Streptomyces brevispora]